MDELVLKRVVTRDSGGSGNGWMVPIFKKDDPFFAGYDMNFVYASAISIGSQKGPHMHKKRECRLVCIQGTVELILKTDDGYERCTLSGFDPKIVVIKAGQPFMIICPPWATEEAILLNFANHIWKQDDQDNYKPDDWNYGA